MFSIRFVATLFLLVLFVLVKDTYGAQAIRKPVPKPAEFADQEGCYDPDLNKVLAFNIPYSPPDKCSRYLCKENGDIIISTCGAIYVPEGEVLLKGNIALPYPDCCDSIDMSHKPKNS